MLHTENLGEQEKRILTPSIQLAVKGEKIIHIQAKFVGDVTKNGIYETTEHLGRALIQVVHHTYIRDRTIDYVSLIHESPEMLRELEELEDFFTCIKIGKQKLEGSIAILEHLEIYKPYRGRGLAKAFIWLLLKALKENIEADYVLLKPYPFEIRREDQAATLKEKLRLEKMYAKSGFRKFPTTKIMKSKEGYVLNYMYMNLNEKQFKDFHW
jgi:GNAT superfamily N-acetyltransferase